MTIPVIYRTSNGRIFYSLHGEYWELTLYNGVWYWDAGAPIITDKEAQDLPIYDGPNEALA